MLAECKKALRISTDAYDEELCSLMKAAAADLKIAGVTVPGTVSFIITVTTAGTSVQDNSTLNDDLVIRAIFTYVRLHFGSPDDYERLREGYNAQKVQLMHATGYTDYDEPDPEEDPEVDGGDG